MKLKILLPSLLAICLVMLFGDSAAIPFTVPFAFAHCDTVEGPVVKDAIKALESGEIEVVLKWVRRADESEIKDAFQKALAVRKLGPQAKEIADMYFFETLVRVHRASEGEPFTGVKPAGTPVEPGLIAADKAMESGSVDSLTAEITGEIAHEIKVRFDSMMEKKQHARRNVAAGREYVKAYVSFIHFIEQLHLTLSAKDAHHAEGEPKPVHGH